MQLLNWFSPAVKSGLLLTCLVLAQPLQASVPVASEVSEREEPSLQIELNGHGGAVRRIAVDSERNLVVTGADDKTARIWSLDERRLLRVLRPPVGANGRGRVYGVALHPQHPWVAIGGSSGSSAEHGIELYDVHGGQLIRRIGAGWGDVKRLQWTEDGRFLVATYAGAHGVRIFDVQGKLVFADAFPGEVYALAVRAGRLAAAGLDGSLRIYDVVDADVGESPIRLRVSHQIAARPVSLAFSPDGHSLVIGYFSPGRAPDVLAWESGAVRALPGPPRMAFEDLRAVAWSARTGRIAAAGSYGFSQRDVRLVTYDGLDRRLLSEQGVAKSSITDITSLPHGTLVYAVADGSWGIADPDGLHQPVVKESVLPELVGASHLRVSEDGKHISWNLAGDTRRVMFDLDRHAVFPDEGGDLPAPVVRRGFLDAPRQWENFRDPVVNGSVIALPEGELSRAVSLFREGGDAVLGTSTALYRIGSDGRIVWRMPTHTEVRAVNTARRGQIIVTSMLDGTVRLWNGRTGEELLALLVMPDHRWIAWTPAGYYDAAPRAADLIGWRVSRGADAAADFFSAARFRDKFNRPDIVDRVLETLNQSEGVKQADAEAHRATVTSTVDKILPPVVDLLTPAHISTSARQLAVRVRVRSFNDEPVTDLWARVNGQMAAMASVRDRPSSRGTRSGGERELTLALPTEDAQVMVFAKNKYGISEPARIFVKWTGAPSPSSPQHIDEGPNLYVLAIGVAGYRNVDKLRYAAKDAIDFADTMKRQQGVMYRKVEVKLLTDDGATRDEIMNGLDWLQRQMTQHDVGMIFLSGHGVNDPTMGYTFLPVNADPAKLRSTGVPTGEFRRTIESLVGKAVLFIDTCHAGNLMGSSRRKSLNDMTGVINELDSAESGTVVFSASTGRQFSIEDDTWKNGAFTKALVEGLAGEADVKKSGRVTHASLAYFVSERVKQLTRGEQSPVISSDGVPDFPLAIIRPNRSTSSIQ